MGFKRILADPVPTKQSWDMLTKENRYVPWDFGKTKYAAK